ncbi:MAG: hypothetical protein JNG88_15720 [Phycisphaerales bacterium]|nr:hypothetical protein [Phycisphaerales bacterium]
MPQSAARQGNRILSSRPRTSPILENHLQDGDDIINSFRITLTDAAPSADAIDCVVAVGDNFVSRRIERNVLGKGITRIRIKFWQNGVIRFHGIEVAGAPSEKSALAAVGY